MKAAIDILRPGTKVSDIYSEVENVIHQEGYLSLWRFGHAIRLDVIDFWSITESNATSLKLGMTIALHPEVLLESEEGVGMGYTFLITDKGNEKLNKINIVD